MILLRILGSLNAGHDRCSWVLVDDNGTPVKGEGPLSELPRHAGRVQLVLPAAQVLITRKHIPGGAAQRRSESMLAFAIEDQITGEIDTSRVIWVGTADNAAVLAVVERAGLQRWHDALNEVGIRTYEIHCETLMLPWQSGQWSLAWDGREGSVRTGQFEGAATDSGDRLMPPLALQLLLEQAQSRGSRPASIAVYTTAAGTIPDFAAWEKVLGIPLQDMGQWDWQSAGINASPGLLQERQRWRAYTGLSRQLRPAAWILAAALGLHTVALLSDWMLLAREQHSLQESMVSRFRATFPDAVAVVNPALQMRRKLAEARHAAGVNDNGDFLPLVEKIAAAMTSIPAGSVRSLSYESGRMTLTLSAPDAATTSRVVGHLRQAGLNVPPPAITGQAGNSTAAITVNAP